MGGEQAVNTAAHKAGSEHQEKVFMRRKVLRWSERRWEEADDGFIGSGYGVRKSTDCDQGNRLIAFVVHFPHRIRIERGFSIHQELVLMVAMGKLQPNDPAAVRHPRHRMGGGLPLVEVANESNTLGLRRAAEEIDQVEWSVDGLPARRSCRI